ncbi:MAG: ATP-binding protein, partial [Clostridia bacterium]|nr:ATP-binding protein [Clostridia bacterium]
MTSKIFSAIPYGFGGKMVEVEGDMNWGLPAFNIVGMANKTINEAKERVRSAIVNSGFSFPDKKVTISLAPADLEKDGSYLDLPIAL